MHWRSRLFLLRIFSGGLRVFWFVIEVVDEKGKRREAILSCFLESGCYVWKMAIVSGKWLLGLENVTGFCLALVSVCEQ